MTSKPTCLWITDADFIEAETFLLQSLMDLRECSDVHALSGGYGHPNAPDEIEFLGFSKVPMNLVSTILKKTIGIDRIQREKIRQVQAILPSKIEATNPDFAWIHFGTCAVQVCATLEAKRVPYFIQVHGIDVTTRFNDEQYRRQFVKCANKSLGVVCSSHHIKRLCILEGVAPEKTTVVKNAVNAEVIDTIQVNPTPFPSFVHLGRLTPKKHPIATLHAFEIVQTKIPNAQLCFIGRGILEPELRSIVKKKGLESNVSFKGALPHKQALHEMSQYWIFCQHSITSRQGDQEGFANSIAEAGLMGIPCISTKHNGIPEHVIHNETGLLVPEHDFEAMAESMLYLATNQSARNEMGQKARNHYLHNYSPAIRSNHIRQLVESITP